MKPKYTKRLSRRPGAPALRPVPDLLIALVLALVAWLLVARVAHAAEQNTSILCVGDSAQLTDALLNGNQTPSVNLDIRVRQGTYSIGAINASFVAPTTIRGGWSDATCTTRSPNPYNTVIDLSGTKLTLKQPQGPSRAALTIDGLTFRNGDSVEFTAGTSHDFSNDPGDLVIRRTRFTQFTPASMPFATLDFAVATGGGLLENVLADHIAAPIFPTCAIGLYTDGASANFSANYVTADLTGPVCLTTGTSQYVSNSFNVSNSIFWSSQSAPPTMATLHSDNHSSVSVAVENSILELLQDYHGNPVNFPGQIDADPEWMSPGSGDYALAQGSPALDAGDASAPLGLPSNDMIGQARAIGAAPDLGALESNGSTVPTFIVGNTNDSGAGSLRQAITDMNANAQPLGSIVFQLPGPCPQTIALQSPLPDITKGMRIEGYTQNGSIPNSDAVAFDANLCVIIKPASGTLSRAFRVPAGSNGQLLLSGVALGGFDQPIMLLGGVAHKISGIQIGGNVNGVTLPGPTFHGIVVAMGSVSQVYIGGPDPSERNVIGGGASGNGINIQSGGGISADHCLIVNNMIGLAQNGTTQNTIGRGINLSGNGCLIAGNRIAGTAFDAIWINGGNDNAIQGNIIGFGVDGLPHQNNGSGVLITGGTGNVVGAAFNEGMAPGSPLANTIRYMSRGGVIVKYDTAANNSIRGNIMTSVGANGPIDLGDDGPTPNDPLDTDSGPNALKNFATVQHLAYVNPSPPNATDVQARVFGQLLGSTAGLNRVDAYFYNGGCAPDERGQAQQYLGSFVAFGFASGVPSDFNYIVTLPNIAADAAIAFTATDELGNTSELGTCYRVANAPAWSDVIFWNDFD